MNVRVAFYALSCLAAFAGAGCSSSGRNVPVSPVSSSLPSAAAATATPSPSPAPTVAPSPMPTATASTVPAATPSPADVRLQFASGFYANVVANVKQARELATLPNGDLLVGTEGDMISIVPNADAPGVAGAAQTFVTLAEAPAASVVVAPNGTLYAATNTTVWKIPYAPGDVGETYAVAIAKVRTGPVAPNSDGDVHKTTSLAVTATSLYVSVGSSCNACVEVDPTRATVLRMNLDGSDATNLTTRTRNAIALAINPATGSLWIGGAGQNTLAFGHPYEYFDSPTRRGSRNVDYGWPECEEDHIAYNELGLQPAPECATTVAPVIEFPAYSTLIGAAFYPLRQGGTYAFPQTYRGGAFLTAHGSAPAHCCPSTPPFVAYVPMAGDEPARPVNWSDPTVQSLPFVTGFGSASKPAGYIGRPTGIAVGSQGSLFIADGLTGNVLRIRHY